MFLWQGRLQLKTRTKIVQAKNKLMSHIYYQNPKLHLKGKAIFHEAASKYFERNMP